MRHLGVQCVFTIGCLLLLLASPLSAGELPTVGDRLEDVLTFSLPAPNDSNLRDYLQLHSEDKEFALGDLQAPYRLVEIVGVYCPVCHTQAPDLLRLFQRIQRDPELSARLAVVFVAAGATSMEVDHLQGAWRFPFPIVRDESYELHKMLGEPDTPFTFLVNAEGSVLYTHLGKVDVDEVFRMLRELIL